MRFPRLLARLAIAAFALGAAGRSAATDSAEWTTQLPPGARVASVWQTGEEASGPAGPTVHYTIDPEIEDRIRALIERSGVTLAHVILMDPATGEILSYVSTDPARFPATRTYPTASLMKIVTSAAVLRAVPGAARRECRYAGSPYTVFEAQLLPPTTGGRRDSFRRSLAISNNQCFARMAVFDLGEKQLLREMQNVGMLDPPGPLHPAGRVEPVEGRLALGHLGSGLAGSFITPLAGARLAALLAHGELVEPRWVASLTDESGRALPLPAVEPPRAVWPPDVADQLRELMVNVTEEGTARHAFHDGQGRPILGDVRVSGKTGTLSGRDPEGLYRWFIGVAPADTPRIAISTVVVNGPPSASRLAAAVLREVFCGDASCAGERADVLLARSEARRVSPEPEPEPSRVVELGQEELDALLGPVGLDTPPRPIGVGPLEFPRPLRKKRVAGEIVLLLELDPEGQVMAATIDSSTLPDFNEFLLNEVRAWRFTPPTQRGQAVYATARLAVPIRIN